MVLGEDLHHRRVQPLDSPLGLPGVEIHEVPDQFGQVVAAFAQRGRHDAGRAETVVQILPEPAPLHFLEQIPIRRADDPDVHLDVLVAADPLEFLLFDDPKQLGLEGGRRLGDLVEQQGAPGGHFKSALPLHVRAGERAFFMAEQFALQQAVAQGGAVDADERPERPAASMVNQQRDQFLARSAFAADQHRDRSGGDLFGQSDGLEHPGARAHDLVEAAIPLPSRRCGRHLAIRQQGVEDVFHDSTVQRLYEEIAASRVDGANRHSGVCLERDGLLRFP